MNIESSQLQSYFQKQFNASKQLIGCEILMRPIMGDLAEMVKILEQSNEIYQLDFIACTTAVRAAERYDILCSSNFSGKTFAKEQHIETLDILDPQRKTKIEITETTKLNYAAIRNIFSLSEMGFKISLDDFGSGYNNLSRLVELPISEIKIDRKVTRSVKSKKGKIAISNTIDLSHKLDCNLIAEGVETAKEFYELSKLGCDGFQGYYFHMPEVFKAKEVALK